MASVDYSRRPRASPCSRESWRWFRGTGRVSPGTQWQRYSPRGGPRPICHAQICGKPKKQPSPALTSLFVMGGVSLMSDAAYAVANNRYCGQDCPAAPRTASRLRAERSCRKILSPPRHHQHRNEQRCLAHCPSPLTSRTEEATPAQLRRSEIGAAGLELYWPSSMRPLP